MGDSREAFDYMKELDKERRERNLAKADPADWTIHTDYHWSRTLAGKRLDYWPSRNKFQYDRKVMCGDVVGFIRNRTEQVT
jgi:hypothetical protein